MRIFIDTYFSCNFEYLPSTLEATCLKQKDVPSYALQHTYQNFTLGFPGKVLEKYFTRPKSRILAT